MRAISREQGVEAKGTEAHSPRDRELVAFTRYCVARIERELGTIRCWIVRVEPSRRGITATITIRDPGFRGAVVATGFDGPAAVWEAMCRLEQGLREARAARKVEAGQ